MIITAIALGRPLPLPITAIQILWINMITTVTLALSLAFDVADYAIGLLPMIGIGLHSFIDGAIYSIIFSVNIFTGVAVAIGMVLHEFPEGIITYVLLLRGGFRERTALLLAFMAAAVTTPLGMAVSFPVVSQIGDGALGVLLALSAGTLVAIGVIVGKG